MNDMNPTSRHFKAGHVKTIAFVFTHKVQQCLFFMHGARRLQLVQRTQVEENAVVEVGVWVAMDESFQGADGVL